MAQNSKLPGRGAATNGPKDFDFALLTNTAFRPSNSALVSELNLNLLALVSGPNLSLGWGGRERGYGEKKRSAWVWRAIALQTRGVKG